MRRFLTYTLGLFIGAAAILLSLTLVGDLTQPPALAIFEPQHCTPHPCWNGLQPGKTSIQQARAILNTSAVTVGTDKFQLCPEHDSACWDVTVSGAGIDPSSSLDHIDLNAANQQVRLGDLMAIYGSPTSATLCWIVTPTNGGVNDDVQRPLMVGNINFRGHVQVFVYNPNDPKAQRFDPDMIVDKINFKALPDDLVPAWRGFQREAKLSCGK